MINLKPCPFCGQKPKLYGAEIRDYIETEEEEFSGWAKKSRKEYWIRPFCMIGCPLGSAWAGAYGVIDGQHYISAEFAAAAWNRRASDVNSD